MTDNAHDVIGRIQSRQDLSVTASRDKHGNLTVPAALIRKIGLRRGDAVGVNANGDRLLIGAHTGSKRPMYKVTSGDRIRISPSVLKMASLDGREHYRIAFVNGSDNILVSSAE